VSVRQILPTELGMLPARRLESQLGGFEMRAALNVIGLCFGVVAAVCLYYASVETPWSMQSWSGQTEIERRFRRWRTWWARVGFVLRGLAFVCQLVAVYVHT